MADTAEHQKTSSSGHERQEANVRLIIETVIGLAISVVVVCLIVWGVFNLFKSSEHEDRLSPWPVRPKCRRGRTWRCIRADEFKRLRAHEDDVLNSYRWVDQKSGVVHIPIDKAMDEVVSQLPMRRHQGRRRNFAASGRAAGAPGGANEQHP